jgi:hypothetical protein
MTSERLTWQEALDLAAADRDKLAAQLHSLDPVQDAVTASGRIIHHGPAHVRTVHPRKPGEFRIRWDITDHAVSPHPVLAAGRAWTARGAWRQLRRAYDGLLAERAIRRSGLLDRRDDGLVP